MTTAALLNHRYRIVRSLAAGGFGKTFLAEDTHMPSQRRCVIKQLKPVNASPAIVQMVQERFIQEAAVLEQIGRQHLQLADLYAYFVQEGEYYLVQEWIEGPTLGDLIEKSGQVPLAEDRVVEMVRSLLPVIGHIHQRGIIHRDIKPANIVLRASDQLPCLVDFGAVKVLMTTVVAPSGQIETSMAIGSPGYMAPEQMAGHPVFASDVYGLGMSAVHSLTGQLPLLFPKDATTGLLLWRSHASTVSSAFADIIDRAIHPQLSERYATTSQMQSDLEGLTQQSPAVIYSAPIQSTPLGPPSEIPQPHVQTSLQSSGLRPWWLAGVGGLGAVILAGIVGLQQLSFGNSGEVTESPDAPAESSADDRPTAQRDAQTPTEPESSETPTTADGWIDQATTLFEEGRNPQALESVDAALAIEPNSSEALLLKGNILRNQTLTDVGGAIALYTQALASDPDNADILDERCDAYAQTSQWTSAYEDCTTLLSLTPDDADIYQRRGDILKAQERYAEAIEDYSRAIALNEAAGTPEKNQPIYYQRGEAYGEAGEPARGLEDFERFREATE